MFRQSSHSGRRGPWRLAVAILVVGLLATACPADDGEDTPDPVDTETPDTGEDTGEDVSEGGEIEIGWIPWEENIANTFLWAEILDEQGYDVTTTQLDVAPAFAGVASGDIDLFLDMWLEDTHATYQEEFGDDLVDLGVWYEPATLELTVPTYVEEVDSLEDLAEHADLFGGEITGIEAGAGMMEVLRDDVMPTYGLEEDFTLLESSTAAMRAALDSAYQAEEPIVVTLWTPHPEYGLKDLKRLEDPEGAWGDPEALHAISRVGFEEDFPEVAEWISNFEMTEEGLGSLNAMVEEAPDGGEREAAREWIDDNQDAVDTWLGQ